MKVKIQSTQMGWKLLLRDEIRKIEIRGGENEENLGGKFTTINPPQVRVHFVG